MAKSGVAGCTYHSTRNVWAVAIGDLDNDGFYDVVSTSSSVIDLNATQFTPSFLIPKGNPTVDKYAFKFPPYQVIVGQPPNLEVEWLGFQPLPGDLFVEISSGNDNNFIKITAKGSKDICLVNGNVNRDGIGAILNINKLTQSITGGESIASAHSFEKIFGLGQDNKADLTIKWPKPNGGYNTNKLNNIKKGESITIYEIPCDYETRYIDIDEYELCVEISTNSLFYHGLISKELKNDLQKSMI